MRPFFIFFFLLLDFFSNFAEEEEEEEEEGRATMAGWRTSSSSSSEEQFQRLVRNWNLHSSMARVAPVWTLVINPGCFLQNWICLVSNEEANWSQIDGVPITDDPTELARDSALSFQFC